MSLIRLTIWVQTEAFYHTVCVSEVIQYYTNNDGGCYALLLDASKAFDTVRYIKLFELLSSKGLL